MTHIYVLYIVPATILIPLVTGTVNKIYADKYLKTIFFYLIFAGSTEIAERVLGSHHINNLPLLHFYTIIEFLFVMQYFRLVIQDRIISRIISILMVLFPLFCVLNFTFFQDIHLFNSYPRPIAGIIIIALCLYYFIRRMELDQQKTWAQEPLNWVTTGLLVYFSSSLFYFTFLNVIYEKTSLSIFEMFIAIHATLVVGMYLFFTAGFFHAKHQR